MASLLSSSCSATTTTSSSFVGFRLTRRCSAPASPAADRHVVRRQGGIDIKTVFVLVLYGIVGSLAAFATSMAANVVGAGGAIIAYGGRLRQVHGAHKALAVLFCAAGQSFVFLSWVAFVVAYTLLVVRNQPVVGWLVWIAAFLVSAAPGAFASRVSKGEELEEPRLAQGVPHLALSASMIALVIGFILFAVRPATMLSLWRWVPFVRDAVLS